MRAAKTVCLIWLAVATMSRIWSVHTWFIPTFGPSGTECDCGSDVKPGHTHSHLHDPFCTACISDLTPLSHLVTPTHTCMAPRVPPAAPKSWAVSGSPGPCTEEAGPHARLRSGLGGVSVSEAPLLSLLDLDLEPDPGPCTEEAGPPAHSIGGSLRQTQLLCLQLWQMKLLSQIQPFHQTAGWHY